MVKRYNYILTCLIIFLIIVLICLLIYLYFKNKISYFSNGEKIFKAPASLTQLNVKIGTFRPIINSISDLRSLVSQVEASKYTVNGNIISIPTFYNSNEDFPGCITRPLYQGTCGSCYGFAIASCLASRFYIESCGVGGCLSYPEINFGSLNNVYSNLNDLYKFRKLYLDDVFKNIDSSRTGLINLQEWLDSIKKYFDTFNSSSVPDSERHNIAQILVYILNFQSLGSINLSNEIVVMARARETFDIWYEIAQGVSDIVSTRNINGIITINGVENNNNTPTTTTATTTTTTTSLPTNKPEKLIDIARLKLSWSSEPISLSAEKIINCCGQCMATDFIEDNSVTNEPDIACSGGSLEGGWSSVRESGVPTAQCVGYNLDAWVPGQDIPTCREMLGPFYSFCTGYSIKNKYKNLDQILDKYENSTISPISIPYNDSNLPYVDPILFRFRAKNVYKVKNNMKAIQKEIIERGPVTAGFTVYDDWYTFSNDNVGGQLYNHSKNGTIVGSGPGSLIYASNCEGTSKGGHAIVIIGWGTFKYDLDEPIEIPYWICQNSYGYNWGHSGLAPFGLRKGLPTNLKRGGFFWMIRGINMCSIEESVVVGQPDLDSIAYPGTVSNYGWSMPSPDPSEVEYISQVTGPLDIGQNNILVFKEPIEGGGTYIDRININSTLEPNGTVGPISEWLLTSGSPPTIFTLFWPDIRPVYCLDPIIGHLDSLATSDTISVTDNSFNKLKDISLIMRNPLLILDNEQMQLLNINHLAKTIQVLRAVNNSELSSHTNGSVLKIMPFKGLSVEDLDKILNRCKDV